MKKFEVFSGYQQFYVADVGLEPKAPEEWNETHILQRHNTLKNITALCPEGDITARIVSCGPQDEKPPIIDVVDFEVNTFIQIETGKIGIYGWPWELKDEYTVENGRYDITFRGYLTTRTEEHSDYYLVHIKRSESES